MALPGNFYGYFSGCPFGGARRRFQHPDQLEEHEQLRVDGVHKHAVEIHVILDVPPDEQGRRDAEGILEGLSADGMVTLKSDDGDYTFPVKAAGYVKLCDDEDLF